MIPKVTFYYEDKLTVVITQAVERYFLHVKSSFDYGLETGGIIVGTLNSGPIITITDVTTSQRKDVRHKFRFLRAANGHQSIMDRLWQESGYRKMYLGEWHTHPESIPSPSGVDVRSWQSIARKKHNTPWALFIILGQQTFRLWTIDNGVVKELELGVE